MAQAALCEGMLLPRAIGMCARNQGLQFAFPPGAKILGQQQGLQVTAACHATANQEAGLLPEQLLDHYKWQQRHFPRMPGLAQLSH